ncbi:nucleoside hydrolase [Demequina lutea]|uniref:Inosine-uridine nucleoside N-ribohydrolase n=1 Tax=Demequina lutea TaxID=431489 RepID=A0A7Y9ZAX1_9MICO|nr:nucleoside hydrolase [Demequina lutea]NYI39956.1 inosine-uridine nucleoside N-ribohydrolase [Demequina lutea]
MATVPTSPFPQPAHAWKLGEHPWLDAWGGTPARARVIIDNDFAGDPDDLVQVVHHLLSPSVEISLIVSSHLHEGHGSPDAAAAEGADVVRSIFGRMGLDAEGVLCVGAERAMSDTTRPQASDATERILAEAMRDDPRPLFYVAGGSLTDLASALLLHPEIAGPLTLVWIGGFGHDEDLSGLVADDEYNFSMDVAAAGVIFDAPELEVWQVPRTTYAACIMSDAEMITQWAMAGPLGAHLRDEVRAEMERFVDGQRAMAETYVMGDSPLVLLTALTNFWGPEASSCSYVVKPTPALLPDGSYVERSDSRPMRLYTSVDVRLMHADLAAKLTLFEAWQRS